MRRSTLLIVLGISSALLLSLGAHRGDDCYYNGNDDTEAAGVIAQMAEALPGWRVVDTRGDLIVVERRDGEGFRWSITPRTNANVAYDRLIIKSFLLVKDDYRQSREMIDLANLLDRRYNLGGFYVDADGDLAFQCAFTFNNYIRAEELAAFLSGTDLSMAVVLASLDDDQRAMFQ